MMEEQPYVREPVTRQPSLPPKRPKKTGFWQTLFGAIIGGTVVGFVSWSIWSPGTDQVSEGTNMSERQTEQVSVDVDTDLTKVVEEVAHQVVGITNVQTIRDFWTSETSTAEAGTGSGVIYKVDGDRAYIVTNHHVVQDAEELEVTFDDGTKVDGKLVGSDIWTDLAIVEIPSEHVDSVVQMGDSDTLKRGETVMAIGNPLGLGFSGSVTVGVISGKDRLIPVDFDNDGVEDWQAEAIQTDAAINPGNSGGALINMAGQLVGINSMKISSKAVEGIGLAIPINLALPIIDQLETTGEVSRPTMGVSLLDLQRVSAHQQQLELKLPKEVTGGVVVVEVLPNRPSALAGLKPYDVIVQLDDTEVEDMISLRRHLYTKKKVGDSMKVTLYREGKKIEVDMQLREGETF